jgi:hypothetical protein
MSGSRIDRRTGRSRKQTFVLSMPARKGLESDTIKTCATDLQLRRKGGERLGNRTGTVDLSIDDGGPIFFVNEVGNVGIRIWVHENLGRLSVSTSCSDTDGAGSQEGLKLCTE